MKFIKQGIQLFLISATGWMFSAPLVAAQVTTDFGLILGDTSPVDIIIAIINWTLGLLALAAVVIILYGGFVWLTSQGDEEKINKAKAILRNAIIGLVIILAAWGIATYIINLLLDITGTNNTNYATPYEPYEPSSGSPFYIDHSNPSDGDEDVPLCHIIAVTFSYPVNEDSVSDSSFQVTIPEDTASNPDGGLSNNESCSDDRQCLSGDCSDSGRCSGNTVAGSFDFSESDYSAVFYPSADYLSDTIYRVELTTDIEGISPDTGAVYNLTSGDAKRIFTFTTGTTTDDIPPTVDVTSVTPYPVDADTNMCLNPTLQVSFSESLDPASPDDENFWLYAVTDTDGDGTNDDPSDSLDVDAIRMTSIGGNADDTIATQPTTQLDEFTEYGLSLYSGDATTETFEGAIYDTCGNPLSGDFDTDMEGSPTDDFADPTSAGVSQAFCSCVSSADSCSVALGDSTCTLSDSSTCTLDSVCSDTNEDYVGYSYQWTFTTGNEPYCIPDISAISQEDYYYSEDADPTGETGSEDSGKVAITGSYLYPFYDVDFYDNVSAAGLGCFDTDHSATMSCFISNVSDTLLTVRTPVSSRTGRIDVENGDGSDSSPTAAIIDSPYIRNTSPLSGPPGQYVTLRGTNFGDYDPEDTTTALGTVYFDDVAAEVMCDDGWDDDQIIVRVPDDFAEGDTPLIQVITQDGYYSNEEGFTITSGDPGPGICELDPSCSDTGLDNVTAIGENFGDDGAVYFTPSDSSDYVEGEVGQWNVYNETYASQTVVTVATPVTEPDTYSFTAGNLDGISNGLDFDITCTEPPQLVEYYQCDQSADTYYLPNPGDYFDSACVNSVVYFGFTNAMDDASVTSNVTVYRCDDADTYDSTTCTTAIDGSFVSDYLNAGYIGGDSEDELDGSSDIDGDGDTDVADAYSAYTFYPDGGFLPNYYYQVSVPTTVTNSSGTALDTNYSWHFRIRDDATNCVADYINLSPTSQIVNNYDSTDACLDRYTYEDTSYSMRARLATSDCLVLDDAADYTWSIDDEDILKFGANSTAGDDAGTSASDTTTIGYNTVCLQGEDESNDGLAVVTANVLDPSDGSVAATDTANVQVDYGFCTQDSDCYTADCRDTYCDPATSHCAPDITGFSPDNSSGSDVGPAGCITLQGCYFGNDQDQTGACTCTSLKTEGETCQIEDGGSSCVLGNGVTTCTLDEEYCTLSETCTTESASANYDLGFFRGCDCTMSDGTGRTCRADEDETNCVVEGTTSCSSASASFVAGGSGTVSFDSTEASYPSDVICEDVWDNDQVIVQAPSGSSALPAGDYSLTLNSYYSLTDTYGTSEGDASDCTVGSDATPCLCRADPSTGREGTTTDLYGEGFTILTTDGGEKASFAGSTSRLDSDGTEVWTSDTEVDAVVVPDGAIADEEGVELDSDNYSSNAIGFNVSCSTNYDCSTGCCSAGQCAPAETCNTCTDDTDCTFGSCQSACVAGTCEPYVIDISPDSGAVGQPVTIQGCHFGTYYDPALYSPGSEVLVDEHEADLACDETDSWSNVQIIATMPDGIFDDTTTDSAEIYVKQVSTSDGVQVDQDSNAVTFTRDDSCSEVDIPVLCDLTPSYAAITDTDIEWGGDNFANQSGGYCTCSTDSLGDCNIDTSDASCTVTQTSTYYVDPDFTSDTCADGSTGAATSNAYTYYDGTLGYCVYTDPTDTSITCNIAVGDSSCTVSDSETCYVDDTDSTVTCSSSVDSYISLDGSATFYNDQAATIDWTQYLSTQYITDVPDDAETGDAVAIATTTDDVQCASNGIEFPITCSECGDCGSTTTNLLNCNLDFDPAFGSCTADTTGFCRANTASCCNLTSCVYDANASATDDLGTCEAQPVVLFDDADADGLTDAFETDLGYDDTTDDTDGDDTIDSDEAGLFNGNFGFTTIDAVTFPTPEDTSVCSNAAFAVEFSTPVTISDVFDLNDNDTVADDPETTTDESAVDLFSDDVAAEDIAYSDYVLLRKVTFDDVTSDDNDAQDVTISNDGTTLSLELSAVLDFSSEYELLIRSNDTVAGGTDHHTGIVDAESGVAVGCTSEMDDRGYCQDGYMRYTFTTKSRTDYYADCGPAVADLEADSDDFIDNSYTFSESGQTEDITTTVYAEGDDGVAGTSDDQPIQRIDDGTDAGFWWEYAWDPIYASIEDLETASCPVAGIITNDEAGSCACTITESCTIAFGDERCTTANGVECYTDSPNAECDAFDSNYDSSTGCGCTTTDSCTMLVDEASCTEDVNGTDVTCTTDSATGLCASDDTGWSEGTFIQDESSQTLTADTPDANADNTDTVDVRVTGDGSVEDGWGNDTSEDDDLTDSLLYDFVYCDPDYLVTYDNTDYNFYMAYCRGEDPQSDSFLPEFEQVFSRDDSTIDADYGSDQDFIYEVGFKDATAASNDTSTNNNIIVLRVYPNDFDSDLTTPQDSINPDLWYTLNTNDASATGSETTIDDYDAVTVGNTVYIAASNLDEASSVISPYVFVIAYSADADDATSSVATAILDGFKFNRNTTLSADCAADKQALIADTDRVTDLGSIAYLLSSYYYADSDGNGTDDFPSLADGSYISGLTTSVWPSWDDTFGDQLGSTLPTDPTNVFADATTNCPYNPPDLSAGETTGTYYDESGTCWDPVLSDFYGPDDSTVYLYQYQTTSDFALYANLEYDGTGTWISSKTYDPCRTYSDTTTVDSSISNFSDNGCATFDYFVGDDETTDNATYAGLF